MVTIYCDEENFQSLALRQKTSSLGEFSGRGVMEALFCFPELHEQDFRPRNLQILHRLAQKSVAEEAGELQRRCLSMEEAHHVEVPEQPDVESFVCDLPLLLIKSPPMISVQLHRLPNSNVRRSLARCK